ncbi:monodehydroascorbate reductase [Tanacetum coccineum]
MDITRAQQIALDDALVTPTNRLTISKSNLRLSSYLKSKEPTLQVVYDVLKLTPFYKAFQIIADVPEIYMQEFWATATVHHHSIRFKMNNKKHIVNLEYFREMLQICPKLPDQQFEEPPFEEEILTFLRDLGHSGEIKVITDVNVNKLHQPWRSFAAVINKCLSGKSTGYDSLRLSQAQILWGMYHKKNVDYAYLLWEDFVYQVENKNVKRSNEMYYPRFTKVIVNFFMTKDSSIPRRNRVNWHFARDDPMFTTIKVVSRHEDTQLYGAILPDELTNEAIKDSESYKEYYAIASGAEPPKTKASVKKKQTGSDKTKTPPTAKGKRLKTLAKAAKPAKMKQPAKMSKSKGLIVLSEVALTEAEQMNDEEDDDDEDNDDDDDNDDVDDNADNQDDEGQDDDNEKTDSDNDGNEIVHPKFSTHDQEERQDEDDNEEEGSDMRIQTPSHYESTDDEESEEVIHGANVEGEELDEEETNEEDKANELYRDVNVNLEGRDTEMTNAPCTISSSVSSGFISNMLNPSPDTAVSSIPGIVDTYLANKMNEAVKKAVQLQSDRLRNEAQADNEDFINKLDDNIKKIIKEQVKEQVKAQTSYLVVANLSELELKKILIDKMESNKSIHRYDEQKNLYKALVDAYERTNSYLTHMEILSCLKYVEMMMIKTKNPPLDQTGGPREEELEKNQKEPMHTVKDLEEPAHQEYDTGFSKDQPVDETTQHHDCSLARKEDTHDSFNELMDTPLDFSAFVMNQLKVDTLTPELLVGPTFELMKGSCKSLVELEYFLKEVYKTTTDQLDWNNPEGQQYPHDLRKPLPLILNSQGRRVIPFDHFINNDLEYLKGGASSRTYATTVTKTKAADYGHVKWIEYMQFYGFAVNRESAHDVYSRHRIIAVTKSIVIQRSEEDLQLGVESCQKILNLTRPDTYISNLKRLSAYSAYPNPRGFIYQNKDKKNKLMRIDELYKFSDGTLNDVRTALDDILKRIKMKYLPQTYWKKFDESDTHVLERFDTLARNPVKEILPKLNLPNHRSIFTDSKEFTKMDMERRSVKVKELKERFIIKAFQDHQIKKDELKAQLQAKNSTINNLKKQIKNVHEKSNEAKHYKDLYDSIKVTRTKTIEQTTSLIDKNDEFKAQLQEKGFTIAALKDELRKLIGNSMNTKFAKPSILEKPILQPLRNQSVVRQPNAFKSERPNFSKPRFASQVDVNNVLSKPVTPHYLPKVREYVLAKPHHVIAPGSSRKSQEESYGSNDMAHNHYLEEARKKTQERNRNSKPSVMHTTSLQNTTNGSKPNTRSNNQISRSLPVSKSSCGMSNGVSLVDHSRNSSSFSDSKHFVCSTEMEILGSGDEVVIKEIVVMMGGVGAEHTHNIASLGLRRTYTSASPIGYMLLHSLSLLPRPPHAFSSERRALSSSDDSPASQKGQSQQHSPVIGRWVKHQQVEVDPLPVSHRQMEKNTLDTRDHAHSQVMVVPALESMVP